MLCQKEREEREKEREREQDQLKDFLSFPNANIVTIPNAPCYDRKREREREREREGGGGRERTRSIKRPTIDIDAANHTYPHAHL